MVRSVNITETFKQKYLKELMKLNAELLSKKTKKLEQFYEISARIDAIHKVLGDLGYKLYFNFELKMLMNKKRRKNNKFENQRILVYS